MSVFKAPGLRWDRSAVPEAPCHSVEQACSQLHEMLPVFVWDAGVLEDNPLTYPEVQALLEGNTVGGHTALWDTGLLFSCRWAWIKVLRRQGFRKPV